VTPAGSPAVCRQATLTVCRFLQFIYVWIALEYCLFYSSLLYDFIEDYWRGIQKLTFECV
jgi:hypothetical protein